MFLSVQLNRINNQILAAEFECPALKTQALHCLILSGLAFNNVSILMKSRKSDIYYILGPIPSKCSLLDGLLSHVMNDLFVRLRFSPFWATPVSNINGIQLSSIRDANLRHLGCLWKHQPGNSK